MRFCAILVLVLLLACNNKNQEKEKPVNLTEEKLALMKVDAAFSDMSLRRNDRFIRNARENSTSSQIS